jgi:hypothetical protein
VAAWDPAMGNVPLPAPDEVITILARLGFIEVRQTSCPFNRISNMDIQDGHDEE